MSNNLVKIGEIEEHWNRAGTEILRYTVEIYHSGLNEHKLISAPDESILENKKNLQALKWNERWEIIKNKQKKEAIREANFEEAKQKTKEASIELEKMEKILVHTLNINDAINWDSLKIREKFKEKYPDQPNKSPLIEYPKIPDNNSHDFTPHFTFFDYIFKSLKEKKVTNYKEKFKEAIKTWENTKIKIDLDNKEIEEDYKKKIEKWKVDCKEWENRKSEFLGNQDEYNAKIDKLSELYNKKDQNAVIEYCDMVLNNSEYPEYFPKNFELEYNPNTGILIVEYSLPNPEVMPRIKEVKYISSRNELKEGFISDAQLEKMYDSVIYQTALRTIHELFEADTVNALEAVSFNGWVNAINKATGKLENSCIISMQVKKQEFMTINLANVDPRACFKKLKGIGSSKLSGITPIQPILQIDKSDRRFIQAHNVADKLDNSTNIAAMNWEEFEHLIRELFEKEFTENGGEVKITQASRDGGVDAVAFDPDPIRGGKIVIQAKRYTNTVDVAAVRDLYGTVINEGATKGILVTTSDYGPDAYEFARNKPLTLLNGGNLLHLLGKHGHKVRIDLKDARKTLGLTE